MSEVKRYVFTIGMDDLGPKECANGKWVSFEDYADLQQKLDTMAAESAALKSFALGLYFPDGTSQVADDDLPEAPASDAYLNSVRAEGVEMFAELTISIGDEEQSETVIYAGKQAKLFAAQLRSQEAK